MTKKSRIDPVDRYLRRVDKRFLQDFHLGLKRYRYDIQSLRDLQGEEVTDEAFAQIRRYLRAPQARTRGGEPATISRSVFRTKSSGRPSSVIRKSGSCR